jgi:hypothetical protein
MVFRFFLLLFFDKSHDFRHRHCQFVDFGTALAYGGFLLYL